MSKNQNHSTHSSRRRKISINSLIEALQKEVRPFSTYENVNEDISELKLPDRKSLRFSRIDPEKSLSVNYTEGSVFDLEFDPYQRASSLVNKSTKIKIKEGKMKEESCQIKLRPKKMPKTSSASKRDSDWRGSVSPRISMASKKSSSKNVNNSMDLSKFSKRSDGPPKLTTRLSNRYDSGFLNTVNQDLIEFSVDENDRSISSRVANDEDFMPRDEDNHQFEHQGYCQSSRTSQVSVYDDHRESMVSASSSSSSLQEPGPIDEQGRESMAESNTTTGQEEILSLTNQLIAQLKGLEVRVLDDQNNNAQRPITQTESVSMSSCPPSYHSNMKFGMGRKTPVLSLNNTNSVDHRAPPYAVDNATSAISPTGPEPYNDSSSSSSLESEASDSEASTIVEKNNVNDTAGDGDGNDHQKSKSSSSEEEEIFQNQDPEIKNLNKQAKIEVNKNLTEIKSEIVKSFDDLVQDWTKVFKLEVKTLNLKYLDLNGSSCDTESDGSNISKYQSDLESLKKTYKTKSKEISELFQKAIMKSNTIGPSWEILTKTSIYKAFSRKEWLDLMSKLYNLDVQNLNQRNCSVKSWQEEAVKTILSFSENGLGVVNTNLGKGQSIPLSSIAPRYFDKTAKMFIMSFRITLKSNDGACALFFRSEDKPESSRFSLLFSSIKNLTLTGRKEEKSANAGLGPGPSSSQQITPVTVVAETEQTKLTKNESKTFVIIMKLGTVSDIFLFDEHAKMVLKHSGWIDGVSSLMSINGKQQGEVNFNVLNNWTVLEK